MTNAEAIETLRANYPDACFEQLRCAVDMAINALTAQDEKRTQERTETHACDCIERQAAIEAILAVTGNSSVRELYEHVQEHGLSDMWSGGVNAAIDIIIAVPPVQPEPTTNGSITCIKAEKTHDRTTGGCISRQAAIDSICRTVCDNPEICESPCDEIKVLEIMPSAQPEIIRCKDCIKREICRTSTTWALAPNDDWFCADAERRTDE